MALRAPRKHRRHSARREKGVASSRRAQKCVRYPPSKLSQRVKRLNGSQIGGRARQSHGAPLADGGTYIIGVKFPDGRARKKTGCKTASISIIGTATDLAMWKWIMTVGVTRDRAGTAFLASKACDHSTPCTQSADLPKRSRVLGPWPIPRWRRKFAQCTK